MRVLVTGANGYVGARIFSDLGKIFDVFGTYRHSKLFEELIQADLTKKAEVTRAFHLSRPDVIVHVAGNPYSKLCEQNPEEAARTNVDATKYIVEEANAINAPVIYISSAAAQEPNNVYGQTKLDGEKLAKKSKSGYLVLRPSLIIGQSPNTVNDRPHNRFLQDIAANTARAYDDCWKFQPTWLGQISEIIGIAIKDEIYGHTIPISVPELTTRFNLAKDILKHFDLRPEATYNDTSPTVELTQDKLIELKLPYYDYEFVVSRTVDEIKKYLASRTV